MIQSITVYSNTKLNQIIHKELIFNNNWLNYNLLIIYISIHDSLVKQLIQYSRAIMSITNY